MTQIPTIQSKLPLQLFQNKTLELKFNPKRRLCRNNDEQMFFNRLKAIFSKYGLHVFMDVRLMDLLEIPSGLPEWHKQSEKSLLWDKHVDFLLCKQNDLAIVCAIELDGDYHESTIQGQYDQLKDYLFDLVKIPFVRFTTKRVVKINDLDIEKKIKDEYLVTKGEKGPFK